MFDNTQKMLFSAATNKDAKDASRTMSVFLNSCYRDLDENAEAISRIWRRYIREAGAAAALAAPNHFGAALERVNRL